MHVVDSSAWLAYFADEPNASDFEAAIADGAKAPGCLRWEVGNAFSAMAKRGRLRPEEVLAALQVFEIIPLQEAEVDLQEALELALRNGIYAYDAYYLAAAKKHRVELLSLDQKMMEVARSEGITTMEIQ